MANFKQVLIGATLVLVFVFLINVNSLPTDGTPIVSAPILGLVVERKDGCGTDADCGHGKCPNVTSVCVCEPGWISYGTIDDKNGPCSYAQRSKQTAFFLSFFLGTLGIDWFYLSKSNIGYILIGILKLLLGSGCFSSWSITYLKPGAHPSESNKTKAFRVSSCFTLISFTWWIVDWARILSNKFPDGNGLSLLPW